MTDQQGDKWLGQQKEKIGRDVIKTASEDVTMIASEYVTMEAECVAEIPWLGRHSARKVDGDMGFPASGEDSGDDGRDAIVAAAAAGAVPNVCRYSVCFAAPESTALRI
jgi:hypothetical protein